MKPTAIKSLIAGTVVVAAVGYLAFAGMRDGSVQYHMKVDEFVASPQHKAERVRLAGTVAEDGVTLGAGRLGASFVLKGEARQVPVTYAGVLPDLFKPGGEVVVEGRLDGGGTFKADLLMTKCASKYDSTEHQHGTDKKPAAAVAAAH